MGGGAYWLWHQVAVASSGHSHGVGDPGHTLGTPWGNPLTSVCGIKWLWHQVAGVGRCLNVNESSSASSRSGCVSLLDQIRRDVVYGTDVRGFPQSVPRVTYSGPSGSRGWARAETTANTEVTDREQASLRARDDRFQPGVPPTDRRTTRSFGPLGKGVPYATAEVRPFL